MARYTFALLCTVVLILLISSACGRSRGGGGRSGGRSSGRGHSSGGHSSSSRGSSSSSGKSSSGSSSHHGSSSGSHYGSSSGSNYGSSSGSNYGSSSGSKYGSSSGSSSNYGSSSGSKYGSSGSSWDSSSGSKYGSSGSSWDSSSGSKYGGSSGSSWGDSSGTGLGSFGGRNWDSSSSNRDTHSSSFYDSLGFGSGSGFGSSHVAKPKVPSLDELFPSVSRDSYRNTHLSSSFSDPFKTSGGASKFGTISNPHAPSAPPMDSYGKSMDFLNHEIQRAHQIALNIHNPSNPPHSTGFGSLYAGSRHSPYPSAPKATHSHAPSAPPMETNRKTIGFINHETGSSGAIQKVYQPGLNNKNPSNPPYPSAPGAVNPHAPSAPPTETHKKTIGFIHHETGSSGAIQKVHQPGLNNKNPSNPPYPSAPGAVHPHAPSAPQIGFVHHNSGIHQSHSEPGPSHIGRNVTSSGGIQKVHHPGLNNQNPGPVLPQYHEVQGSGHPQYSSAPGVGHPQYAAAPGVGHPQYVQQPNVHYPTNQNVPYPRQPGGPIYVPQYHSQPQYYHPSPHLPPPPPGYSAYGVPIIYQSRDSTNDLLLGLTLWNMQRNNHHHHSHWDHDHHSDYHHHHYHSNPNEEEYHRENYERHTTYYTPKNPNPTTTGAHNTMQMTYYITPDDKGGFSTSMGNLTCMSVYNMKAVSRWANYTMRQFHKDYPNEVFPLFANLNGTEKVNFTITPGSIVHNETASITCCGTDKGHLDVTKIASGKYPDVNCVHYLGKIPFRKMIFTKIPPPSPVVNMSVWHQVTLVNMSSVDVNGSTPTPLGPFPTTTTTPAAVDMSQTFSSLGNTNTTTPLPPMSNGTELVDKNQTFTSLGANNSSSLGTNQTLRTNNTSTTVAPITVLTNNSEPVNLNETFASLGADRSTTTAVPLYPNELTVD